MGTPQSYQGSIRSNENSPSTPDSPEENDWIDINAPSMANASSSAVNDLLLSGSVPSGSANDTFVANVERMRATKGSEEPPEFPALQGGGISFHIHEKDALEFLYGSNASVKQGGSRFRKTFRKANKKQATRRARH
jgi:hypothetical protein